MVRLAIIKTQNCFFSQSTFFDNSKPHTFQKLQQTFYPSQINCCGVAYKIGTANLKDPANVSRVFIVKDVYDI